jgi:hypothetical protein
MTQEEHASAPSCWTPLRVFLVLSLVIMPCQVAATLIIESWLGGFDAKAYRLNDYQDYYKPAAESIAHGQGPMVNGKVLTTFPVGYPAYLAVLVKASEATGIAMERLLVGMNFFWNLATMGGAFLLAFRIGGLRVAVAAVLLVGLSPFLVYISAGGQAQVPYLALMVWCVYLVYTGRATERLWPFALAGVLLGLGGLMRIETLTLVPALGGYLLFSRARSLAVRVARPAVLVGVFCLVVSPWILYLYDATGSFVLLSAQTFDVGAAGRDLGQVTGTGHITAFLADPAGHTVELLKRAVMAWYHTDGGNRELFSLAANLPYLALSIIGFAVVMAKGRDRWAGGLALVLVLAIWAVSTLTFFVARLTMGSLIICSFVPAAGAVWIAARAGFWPRNKADGA